MLEWLCSYGSYLVPITTKVLSFDFSLCKVYLIQLYLIRFDARCIWYSFIWSELLQADLLQGVLDTALFDQICYNVYLIQLYLIKFVTMCT